VVLWGSPWDFLGFFLGSSGVGPLGLLLLSVFMLVSLSVTVFRRVPASCG
jgi:hypothetical protein